MIHAALNGQSLPIYGDGMHCREWLYVEDHVTALSLLLSEGERGEVYNIGSGEERDNSTLVKSLIRLLAKKQSLNEKSLLSLMTYIQDRPGHDFRYALDTSKMEKTFGWKAEHSLEQALDSTIEWYLSKRSRPLHAPT